MPPEATPPTVTPPATPPPAAPPVATPPPAVAPDWKAGLNPEIKGYVELKGFQSPEAMADSYRNLEKLQGHPAEKILKLPDVFYDDKGKMTPEGKAVYERLGAPKEAKDYNLPAPKEGGDPKLLDHFKNTFLEAGIPKDAAKKIIEGMNQYFDQASESAKTIATNEFNNQTNQLKTEWGSAYEQNERIAKEAVRVMGMTKDQVAALASGLGHKETMKLFHKLGTSTAEAPFVGGKNPNNIMEPATAQSKIAELKADKDFSAKLLAGDVGAKQIWAAVHEQAYPGQMSVG